MYSFISFNPEALINTEIYLAGLLARSCFWCLPICLATYSGKSGIKNIIRTYSCGHSSGIFLAESPDSLFVYFRDNGNKTKYECKCKA